MRIIVYYKNVFSCSFVLVSGLKSWVKNINLTKLGLCTVTPIFKIKFCHPNYLLRFPNLFLDHE